MIERWIAINKRNDLYAKKNIFITDEKDINDATLYKTEINARLSMNHGLSLNRNNGQQRYTYKKVILKWVKE